ncbi:MAG: hypothetical protein RJQ08_11360 [Salinisphaeraceae bacterium]
MNANLIVGQVMSIEEHGKSKLMLLRYGPPREKTKKAVQFVNAIYIRIPESQVEAFNSKNIREADVVTVTARNQGVMYSQPIGQSNILNEVIALNVTKTALDLDIQPVLVHSLDDGDALSSTAGLFQD